MSIESNVYVLFEPALMPTAIELDSIDEEAGEDRQSRMIGVNQPFILINGYQFYKKDVVSFNLDLSDKLPRVNIMLEDTKGVFRIDSYPRDGDVVTVLINSLNPDTYKSIHMDFDIVNVSDRPQFSKETVMKFNISGTAKIPGMYSEDCKHYDEGTSFEHLEQECKTLGLGMASNVDQSNDRQVRIQPWSTHLDFIQTMVDSSYVSEESFQTWYVDQWYYLNFIDINKVFNAPNSDIKGTEDALMTMSRSLSERAETDEDNDSIPTKLILTNHFDFKGYNTYIEEFYIINSSSEVALTHGTYRDVAIWDDNRTPNLEQFTLDPLTSNVMFDYEEPLRGRRDEDRFSGQLKHKWMGRQDVGEDGLGNSHSNHLYSQLHNVRNRVEAGKMKLVVRLVAFNPSLYKYQKVPVIMYHYERTARRAQQSANRYKADQGFTDQPFSFEESEDPKMVMDQFLSGNYIIENINLIYRRSVGTMIQEVTLIRREWPTRLNNI